MITMSFLCNDRSFKYAVINRMLTTMTGEIMHDIVNPLLLPIPDQPGESWKASVDALNHIIDSVKTMLVQRGVENRQGRLERVASGMHVIVQLLPRAGIPSPFTDDRSMTLMKLICISYLIHGLDGTGRDRVENGSSWDESTVLKEIDGINGITGDRLMDSFLPTWKEFINDIASIVNGTIGGTCKLPVDDIEIGTNMVRVVDMINSIRHPSMKEIIVEKVDGRGNGGTLVDALGNIFGKDTKVSVVRVTKKASRFTNVMLNQAIDVLKNRGIHPLRVFDGGAVVFGTENSFNAVRDEIDDVESEIGDRFSSKVNDFLMRDENLGNLYGTMVKGITIGDIVYQQPDNLKKIRAVMEHMFENITPLKHDPKNPTDPKKSSRFNAASKLDAHVLENYRNDKIFVEWEGGNNESLMNDDTIWRIGRYVHTAFFIIPYAFNTWTGEKVNIIELMREMLDVIGILDKLDHVVDKFDVPSTVYRYYFSHVIGKAIVDAGKTMNDVKEPLIRFVVGKVNECHIEESFMEGSTSFIRDHLQLIETRSSSTELVQPDGLPGNIRCTGCGKSMRSIGTARDTKKMYVWKSQFVPSGVPVEKFSNFLEAGKQSKSSRMICDSCRWRYYFDKILSTVDGKNIVPWYCTFHARGGLPYGAIASMQQQVDRIKECLGESETSFRVVARGDSMEIETLKVYGFMVPSIPDEICGSFTIDWKIKKKPVNEQFIELMEQVLLIATRNGMQCVVARLRNDYENMPSSGRDIVFQDIPQDFKPLLGCKNWVTIDDANTVLEIIGKINSIVNQIVTKGHCNHKSEIVKRMDDPLSMIRYIENKWNGSRKKNVSYSRSRYLDAIKDIMELKQKISRS